MSLSGFYYQDLKTLDVTGFERVVLSLMEFYSRQKVSVLPIHIAY